MSVGNLKDYGNKGNNFPFQLQTLQLLGQTQMLYLTEKIISDTTAGGLQAQIVAYFQGNPNSFLVSKSVVYDGSNFNAFLSVANL